MKNLNEIVQNQYIIQHKHFDLEINRLIQLLDQGTRISRKEIQEIFNSKVKQVVDSLQDTKIAKQYTQLYNDIYDAVYCYEKDFLIKKRSVQPFLNQLNTIQQNYQNQEFTNQQNYQNQLNTNQQNYQNQLNTIQQDNYNQLNTIQQNYQNQLNTNQQNYQKELSDTKQTFSEILGVQLDTYYNSFNLNLELIKDNYAKNFLELTRDDYAKNFLELTKDSYTKNFLELTRDDDYAKNFLELIKDDYAKNFIKKMYVSKTRIDDNLNRKIYDNRQISKDKLYADLIEMKSFFNRLDKDLEIAKNRATSKLVKERSRLTLDLFNWDNDSQYMKYMSHWKSEFIIDKFLGIAGQYLEWKYPVAYIDPNIGELTKHILSGDPFYVIDDRTMPYDNLLQSLPVESQRKIHRYNKNISDSELEDSSIQVCISWNNFPFMTQGNINKDLILMSKILKPGGYAIFNYADAHSVEGIKFCTGDIVPVCWKQKIDQFARENQLTEKVTYNFKDYPFSVAVYQKEGHTDDINIVNKLGLVLPDPDHLQRLKEEEETKEEIKQRIQKNKHEQNLKRMRERDKQLQDIDTYRKLGDNKVLESKLQSSVNHLNSLLAQSNNDYTQPSALEAVLHISKLTHSLGRIKDSKNILKRVSRNVKNMDKKQLSARKFQEWENFLNNIDT
jgi:hypothetical protein